MMRDSDVKRTIKTLEKNMGKKLYLVEAVSMFRMRYVIEAREEGHAADEHTMEIGNQSFKEFSQEHVGENITSIRELSKKEYFELFDKDNHYLKEWPKQDKMKLINKIDYKDEEDTDNGV
jgi:hypothetical protein